MQTGDGISEHLHRGTKRKFFAENGSVLEHRRSLWDSRKPNHLRVVEGFLPQDSYYKVVEVSSDEDLRFVSLKNRRCIQKDLKRNRSAGPYFVVEKVTQSSSNKFFSKFHSVVEIMLSVFYEPYRLRAKPLAMAATDCISDRFDTIFEMSEEEFVEEYRLLKKRFCCTIPAVENGLCIETKYGSRLIVKGDALLSLLHEVVENNISTICPTKRALLTIKDHFAVVSDFRLHFDSLYLLCNAELNAIYEDGETVELYAKSAFDLLYDAWVCCYMKHSQRYKLLFLSCDAWDAHSKGLPLILTEYSKDVANTDDKESLCILALRAATHYDFLGLNFIISENSVFYGKFKRKCINA